ncbi:MAG: CPBP family intramembrane glutamic endopeptidase [Ferruginibacter sp.]
MQNEILRSILRVLPFLIVVIVIIVLIKRKKINPLDIDLQKPVSYGRFFTCLMAFAAYTLLTELVLYKMDLLQVDAWTKSLLPSVIQIVGIVILAPIAEELLFRGLVLSKLIKAGVNQHLAIIIISALFVAAHQFTYQNTITSNIGIVQSYVDAVLFSYARFYTKSLFTSMVMHSFGNAVAVVERFIF